LPDADAALRTGEDARTRALRLFLALLLPILILVVEFGVYLFVPRVLSPGNLRNILIQSSYLVLFASAQMVVILTRGFDLSLGTSVSAVSVASALVMTSLAAQGLSPSSVVAAGLAAGLGFGLLIGLFNGSFIAGLHISPFIVTLGSLNICLGLATTMSGGRPVFDVPDLLSSLLYNGKFIPGIPVPVLLAVVVCLLLHILLSHTVFGRSLYLIGNNPRAAELAGIPSRRYLMLAYVLAGVLAAFGSLMLTARTGSGEPNLGGSLMLESIAAAVIGGVSLQGGVGGVVPVILGSLFITMMSNAMNLLRIDGYIQQIILGVVIIAAIFLDRIRSIRT
jgi:ribose transport system permease protein